MLTRNLFIVFSNAPFGPKEIVCFIGKAIVENEKHTGRIFNKLQRSTISSLYQNRTVVFHKFQLFLISYYFC